ncbi:MAG TPA: hypothetical protein VEX69_06235 [Candidatus Limnocylindria bacterium]|nr:hypothetical protein [Candidatus Limnocylindria bacterium]
MKNSRSLTRQVHARACRVIGAAALALAFAGNASAQAGPGPISGAPDRSEVPASVSSRSGGRGQSKWKLAGDWKLNRNQSDDPRQKMEKATGSPRGSVGTNGPWGGMGGGGHRTTGPGVNSGRAAKQYADLMDDYTFISITQTDKMVRVTSDSGRLLAYYSSSDQSNAQSNTQGNSKSGDTQGSSQTSSQGNSKPADGGGSKTSSVRMQGDQLVVVSTRDGVKTTRTYSPSADGTQLDLTTRIEGGHLKDPVTILFVYDPPRPGDDDETP